MAAVYLLGAGFNVDAATEAADRKHQYPLLGDLARDCFTLPKPPADKSIEDLFAEAIQGRNNKPMDTLADSLMAADHYLIPRLQVPSSAYSTFFRASAAPAVITFNYDSLVELMLFSQGRWRPDDGYGVPVYATLQRLVKLPRVATSSSTVVLHLHGSLCVYPSDYRIQQKPGDPLAMIELKDAPDFVFDPDVLTDSFSPFERTLPTTGFTLPPQRVVAPVPNKASELAQPFVQAVYALAQQHLSRATEVVVIGYSFNPLDEPSYLPLIGAMHGKPVTVVDPAADVIVARLRATHAAVRWSAVPMGFARYVRTGVT